MGGDMSTKDKVLMDKKTYEELMNYLVKGKEIHINLYNIVECKRIEKDRILSNSH